ncbi:DUF6603 domain-containing protein [Actinopolymorpha sp. NPDC004070]|uniref:DUF6603 domain-containing protein n=1 Tax=Actinopolymorpha sp. NPDC004070 TaxID=3154548 RepID=UPI0033A88172
MATKAGTLELVARELAVALGVLEDRLADGGADDFFAELGLRPPEGLTAVSGLANSVSDAARLAGELAPLVVDLTAAIDAEDVASIVSVGVRLLGRIGDVLGAVGAVAAAADAAAGSLGGLTPEQRAEVRAFAAALPRKVLDHVVVEYASQRAPAALGALDALGLVVRAPVNDTGDPLHPAHERRELHPERLPDLLRDPGEYFRAVYGWGEAGFDGVALFEALQRYIERDMMMPAVLLRPPGEPPLLEAYIVGLRVDTATAPPSVTADIRFGAGQTFTRTYPLKEPWQIRVEATGAFAADVRGRISPPFDVTLTPPGGTVEVDVSAGLVADAGGAPMLLLGAAGGTRVEATRVSLTFGFDASWDPVANQAGAMPEVTAEIRDGRLVLSLGGADGFLASVLPSALEVELDLNAVWDPGKGLRATGGAGLEVEVPLALDVGPARIERMALRFVVTDDGLAVEARAAGGIALGPFAAAVDGVGAAIDVALTPGNLGPLDLGFRFLPPTGLGLAIDAGPISGGGFIRYDEPTGRYGGTFEVKLGIVGVQAVGLLDTRMPGGGRGFALLVLMRASFPPIQLGFGFALSAVGGLVALNRQMDVDALRSRMATGTAGRILAPEDPVRNAPVLLADLAAVFPPAQGVVVVGPTLQLSWAELVRFDIGVFIELPGPRKVVLLGSARAGIDNPSGGRPYLQIRLDILGVVDFAAQTLSFDAVLVDSHLLEILELTGGAAFRMSWGAEPYVVLSVGGFHPSYSPAPMVLPASLTRVAMVRGTPQDFLYFRFEGYFAVTTNTLQFGASVEVVVSVGSFNIRGFLGFDALIRFQPFHFQFTIAASVKVRYKSRNLGGLTLRGELSGPGPVVFRGKVCFEILWFDICFEETFRLGSSVPPAVTPVASAVAELAGELAEPGNIHAVGGTDTRVTVEPATDTSLPVVSPLGQAAWSQERAPLDLLLQRFEGAPLIRPESVTAAGPLVTAREVDWFAPGSFAELKDADALNRRAFERLAGGVRIGQDGTADGPDAQLTVTVKVIRLPAPPSFLTALAMPAWLMRATAGRLGAVERDVVKPALGVRDETWAVHGNDGAVIADGLSQAQAHQLATVGAAGGAGTGVAAVAATDTVAAMAF